MVRYPMAFLSLPVMSPAGDPALAAGYGRAMTADPKPDRHGTGLPAAGFRRSRSAPGGRPVTP